jgi:hypothetical protein
MAMSQSEIRLLQRKADKYEEFRARIDKYHDVWSALDGVVEAWEHPSKANMETWMVEQMIPAINVARKALGRKTP